VAAVLPHGADLLVLWLATARVGGVFVPVNPALTAPERATIVHHVQPRLIVADADPDAARWDGGHPRIERGWLTAVEPADEAPPSTVDPGDPVTVLYTSGTTGLPKGCLLSHRTYTAPAPGFVDRIGLCAEDRLLACLPLFHMAGQSFAVSGIAAGAHIAIVRRFSASRFWQQAVDTGATVFRYLGEMLPLLLRQQSGPAPAGHRLRLGYGGGARPAVRAAFERRFGIAIVEGYGLSETNTVLCGPGGQGSLGMPLPPAEVRVDAPPGEIGELQVRGPALMLGYHRDPERTAATRTGEWQRTGDLGRAHPDGSFSFVARRSDLIRRRGEHVDPAEVEEALTAYQGVAAAAVIAAAGTYSDDRIEAFVVPARGHELHPAELRAWCAARLAAFKRPDVVTVIDRMPMTATTKIDKPALLAMSRIEVSP
jgi:acyl-CoA synthetase (AMP-forming)/AMP-acid ligase II